MTWVKRRKGWRMSCEVTERLENEQSLRHISFSNPFRRFTYVTAHSPTLPLLHLRHSSFSNPCFASPTSQDFHLRHLASRPCTSPTSQLILQPFHRFTYVTAHSPTLLSLLLRHKLFTWRAAHDKTCLQNEVHIIIFIM